MSDYDRSWPTIENNFEILWPLRMNKGEQVIGHASSNVRNVLLEEEIERLRETIKQMQKEKERHSSKTVEEDWDDEDYEAKDFFEKLEEEKRKVKNGRSKSSTSRTRRR